MKFVRAFLAVILTLVLAQNFSTPSFATSGHSLEVPQSIRFLNSGNASRPMIAFDVADGSALKYNKTTKSFDVYAPAAPDFPNSYIYGSGYGYLQSNGDIIYVLTMQNSDYSRTHIYKNVFHAGSWGAWQLLRDSSNLEPFMSFGGYTFYQGHDVLLFSTISGDYSVQSWLIGTNLSGTWQELKYRTNHYDNLYPGSVIVADQLDANFESLRYFPVFRPEQTWELDIRSGKLGLFGYVESDTPNFNYQGTSFTSRWQMFSQLVSLNPLAANTRKLIGEAQPFIETDIPTAWNHSVSLDEWDYHWNAAGDGLVVAAQTRTLNECWETPIGAEESRYQRGHCTQTATLTQYSGTTARVLASITGTFGEAPSVVFTESLTGLGWVAAVGKRSRDIEVDGDGDYVQRTGTGDWGWTTLIGDINGVYTSRDIVMTNSTNVDNKLWMTNFEGNPATKLELCTNPTEGTYTCTIKIVYQGEGKSKTDTTPFEDLGTDLSWMYDTIASTGSDWVSYKLGNDNSVQPSVATSLLMSGLYAPVVTKSAASMSTVATSLKKSKTLSLPVKTKQGHGITWAVAAKSKKICSLTTTKSYGITTKVTLKGVKAGSCSLTAKASAGFFYKALSKTITIKVK